jgi:hypothetical protein
MKCILCDHSELEPVLDGAYRHCRRCDLRFLIPERRLSAEVERERYKLHQTAVEDVGYRQFVAPLLERVQELCSLGARGLDYGAGHQPILAEHLRALGFDLTVFDPFFFPDPQALARTYDFVVACEVIEHFFSPQAEFARLRELVGANGALILNTQVYEDGMDFASWYYRRDPTHVSFYSAQTFAWIGQHWNFSDVRVGPRVVSLRSMR